MYQLSGSTQAALDYNSTIIGALELSKKKWVLAVQLPGVSQHSRHVLEACGDGLASFVERSNPLSSTRKSAPGKRKASEMVRRIQRSVLPSRAASDPMFRLGLVVSSSSQR
jgi:hypothetical protein